ATAVVPAAASVAPQPAPQPIRSAPIGDDAAAWFQRVKPQCNPVEVNVLQRSSSPPSGVQGAGYHAACFALAGRIDDARAVIDSLSEGERRMAASIVFEVGHPVADAGDDRSAGPMMELVVGYQPDNYMALYHAGISQYMLGERDLARKNLSAFLELYKENDGWRSNGLAVLAKLNDSTNVEVERTRPREPGS
ncbi:MAG: serine/threonine protein kinase, partial [Gemmatimonadetes bacterium]|nr:serine/threonine protein kinase [Gemmatimonadota bacterium]